MITSPIKAIRAKCLECCCGQANEVKLCPCTDCHLYPFRFGKNPYVNRRYTEEQKEQFRQQLEKNRQVAKEK